MKLLRVSAFDRSATVCALRNPWTWNTDLARPGHILPSRAATGGVLRRAGSTEAAIDLRKLDGLFPAAGFCEMLNGNGTNPLLPELLNQSEKGGWIKRVGP